ncbi:hypothetical protein ABL78_2468 [Leptomonas seymouri]|uniref:PH domain-containing protein n=1 Tax=Leptomonas seymouri TaxID=5684 RepID=A0A0N1I0S8_LEPSE|nr:hypothetical protein ABL78_2468 [Leptomonas seymouri]|eukprot:KPI88403.1 hypothetical protein ABL78_2468 [Leptomonas seymouri]
MSGFNMSASDAAVVCLRVMRRLLQDEEVTLAQLNYLIENIHDPLAQACLPASQRPVVPVSSSLSPPSSNRSSCTTRQHGVNASAHTPSQAKEIHNISHLRRSPRPAVVSAQGGAKPSRTAPPAASKHKSSPVTHKAPSKLPAPPMPLTFSQHWDLFANLPTLYTVQRALIKQLEGILQRLTLMVDDLQPPRETSDGASPLPDDADFNHHGNPTTLASPETHAAPAPTYSCGSTRRHVSTLRFPNSGSIPGNRSVYSEIGVMLNEFFGSELMKHYMAEHMMYTVKYTQRAAPQLLRLARIWRWAAGATSGSSSGVSAAALASLPGADRTTLLQYSRFLDFLWQLLGREGTPQDSRVPVLPSLEFTLAAEQALAQAETANATSIVDAVATASGNTSNNGQRRARTTTTTAGTAAGTSSSGASRSALPPIPARWGGFRTMLALLATPLNGLRRYFHVARCLVESGALQPKERERLQEAFIDVAALRMSEETNLVVEELWAHDAASITALMDMPGSRSAGDKTGLPVNSRRVGTGGVGAAGVGVVGQRNVHKATNSSVAGTGGAEAAIAAASASGSPAPASAGVSTYSMPSDDCSNRVLIHYGRLSKRFGRGRHERLIFLFNDWMCYVEECSNGRFRVRGTIPLPELRVVEVRDTEANDATHGFELLSPNLPKRLIFFAASLEQRGRWVEAIRRTVQRYCSQQHPLHEGAPAAGSRAVTNFSVIAPAVTMGETGLPNAMRATAPVLSVQSRLSRQRRYDGVWQNYLDGQRRITEAFTHPSAMVPAALSGSLGGTGGGGSASLPSASHSPLPLSLSSDPSRDSSFAGQRSLSAHRQLEYDVTPWSQQASVHRRIRTQDWLAAHQQQQQQQQAVAPSSHTASTTQSAGTRLNMSLSARPEEIEKTIALPVDGCNMGGVPTLENVASLSGLAEEGHAAAQPPIPLLPSPSERSPRKLLDRSYSNSLHPAALEASGSASARICGSTGLNTPLRRPVSERFEAVKSMGSSGPRNSSAHHHRSNSLLNTSSPPSIQLAGAMFSDAGLTQAAAAPPPTSGAALSSPGEAEQRSADAAVEESSSVMAVEYGAAEQVVLDDSVTEFSAPIEGEEEEEDHLESESTSDVPCIEADRKKESQHSVHIAGPHRLYNNALNAATAPRGEEEGSSRTEACSGDSSRILIEEASANQNAATPSEPYDEDLNHDDGSVFSRELHLHGEAAAASRQAIHTRAAGPALCSASLKDSELATTQVSGCKSPCVKVGPSVSSAKSPNTAIPLDKSTEDDVAQKSLHIDPMADVGSAQRRKCSDQESEHT